MDNIEDFLRSHVSTDKTKITHTRIGNIKKGIYPGSYTIEDKDIPLFYKLYHQKVFVLGKEDYFTEKQLKNGNNPILIDFDFRYDDNIDKRQHNEEHIQDLIDLYMTTISEIVDVNQNDEIKIFIMEKDNVNIIKDKSKNVTKDGIHMIICLSMDHVMQYLLRSKILENIKCIFDDLPLKNSYDNVLDDGITKGHTNWQMFGSNKPDNEPYKIKYIYNAEYQDDNTFEFTKLNKDDYSNLQLLKEVSARNDTHIKYKLKDSIKEEYENMKTKMFKKKTTSSKGKNNSLKNKNMYYSIDTSSLKNVSDLQDQLDDFFETLSTDNNNLIETHKYLMCLPPSYADDYSKWIRCGWALHNTNNNMFLSWMVFSSQSPKFDIGDVEGYYEEWLKMDEEGLTDRSIMYWAKQENPTEYNIIRKETIDFFMERSAKDNKPNESDIAQVLYQLYKDEYRCSSIKHKIWYRFMNHRWVEIDCGTTLRYNISRVLARMYGDKSDELRCISMLDTTNESNDSNNEYLVKLANKYNYISSMLKSTTTKQNIMKEAAEAFYHADQDFEKKLDSNPELLCFTNGVYDFKNKVFRDGQPDDYLTICTNIAYIPYNKENPNHIKIKSEIETFLEQLFPDENLRKYMWEHLASTLIGLNKNQTINIYNGCGRNGKSKLAELMQKVLGDYFGNISAALITSKRPSIGGLSPELVKIKGCRYVLMSEPSKDDKINDGYMKQLTGGDPIEARGLHRDPITYIPFFKLVVCTNNLFDIKSNDDGTWRRIRICEFESKFVKNPNPTDDSPYEFLMDENIDKKFDDWKNIFAGLLVDIVNTTGGIVNDCDRVLQASNDYRKDQDYLMQFYSDKVEKGDDTSIIKKNSIYQEFKSWYIENYGKNIPKGKELYSFLEKRIGKYKNGWKGYRIIYDDHDDEENNNLDCEI
jgi:P4 family phage/plasmid primase-like protien